MQKTIGIYHKNCIDGTAAAAVLLRKFPEAVVFPLPHAYTQEDIQMILAEAGEGTEFFTVDCGLGAKELLAAGYKVTTLDHHIGGKEEFEALAKQYANYIYVFDNDKSGATVTWNYLFPQENQPELLKYVEDSDLWRHTYGKDTQDINNYLSMFRNEPETILSFLTIDLADIKTKGRVLSMYAEKEIEGLLQIPPLSLKIGEHIVQAYNIGVYASAVGNAVSETTSAAALLFTIRGNEVKFSIRSKEGVKPSALDVAKMLGGGGHSNSAGATITLSKFLSMIV